MNQGTITSLVQNQTGSRQKNEAAVYFVRLVWEKNLTKVTGTSAIMKTNAIVEPGLIALFTIMPP